MLATGAMPSTPTAPVCLQIYLRDHFRSASSPAVWTETAGCLGSAELERQFRAMDMTWCSAVGDLVFYQVLWLSDIKQITSSPVHSLVLFAFWLYWNACWAGTVQHQEPHEILSEHPELISHWCIATEPGAVLWRIRPSRRRSITVTLARMPDV